MILQMDAENASGWFWRAALKFERFWIEVRSRNREEPNDEDDQIVEVVGVDRRGRTRRIQI